MASVLWPFARESSDSRSWALLLAILAAKPGCEQAASVSAALANPDMFASIVAAADRERVVPALHAALAGRVDKTAAKLWRAILAKAYRDNRQRNADGHAALVELGAAGAGVRLAALKGAAWIVEDKTDYAAWRSMIDLDVLVDAEQFDRMPALLARLSYEPTSQSTRFRNNFHHTPFWRPNTPLIIEVHRHLGWRHELLTPEIVFGRALAVAPGLVLPAPWCRAFHAIIHWQVQDFGLSRSTVPLKDVVEVARFLGRTDVDWGALGAHARSVGCHEACEAAVALAAELLGAPVPDAFSLGRRTQRRVNRALSRRASPLRTWLATEIWRAGTLWRCEKVAYRLAVRGAPALSVEAAVWAARALRLPILAARAIGILARGVRLSILGSRLEGAEAAFYSNEPHGGNHPSRG